MLSLVAGAAACLLAAGDTNGSRNLIIEAAPRQSESVIIELEKQGFHSRRLFGAADEQAATEAGLENFLIVDAGTREIAGLTNQIATISGVKAVQADGAVSACGIIPNDPEFPRQHALRNTGQLVNGVPGIVGADIGAPEAWAISTGSPNVAIAILDTGVSSTHPDLSSKILAARNFVGTDPAAWEDLNGHGTHSAGIALARSDNGVGVAGVCWDCPLVVARVLDEQGMGTWSGVAAAIVWAADQSRVKVISLNFGGAATDTATQAAANYAVSRGKMLIAAAGNTYGGEVLYPAKFDNCIAVSATDHRDQLAAFSAQGDAIDLCAPGAEVLSSFGSRDTGDSYAVLSGTSMAAPHVAGLAGLIWSINPGLSPTRVRLIMTSTARDLGMQGKDSMYGAGRIDAARAAFMARAMLCSADFNLDGTLDFFDYLDFVTLFGSGDRASDYNGDGILDFFDYLDFTAAFSGGC